MAYTFRQDLFPTWRGLQPWRERLSSVRAQLLGRFPELERFQRDAPYQAFESLAGADAPPRSYGFVPEPALAFLARAPEALRGAYLSGLLVWNMERFAARFEASGFEPGLASHFIDAFHRILDEIDRDPGSADFRRDAFIKDLWICRAEMVPAFAQVWWRYSGLSKRALLRAGLGAAAFVAAECRGLAPFLEGHTHDPVAKAYWNPDGWVEALRIAASVLRSSPQHRGAFGTAWFYDPAIERVSPRIHYASALQVGHRAYRFRVGPSAGALSNALATSPTRRELHTKGLYLPMDYTIVWSRAALEAAYGTGFCDQRRPSSSAPASASA